MTDEELMNCPFYGRSLFRGTDGAHPFFAGTAGNQCALITDAHSPCVMETIQGKPPDWSGCVRNPERNGTGSQIIYANERPDPRNG